MSESSKSEGSAYHGRATFHHPNFTGNKPNLSVNWKFILCLSTTLFLKNEDKEISALRKPSGDADPSFYFRISLEIILLGLVGYNFAKRG